MDLKQYLVRQLAFSRATFGPGIRTNMVTDHIRKELAEVEDANGHSQEWVDVVILALDGLTRQLLFSQKDHATADTEEIADIACRMIKGKQNRNEGRDWPDWRSADPHKAIEHIRTTSEGGGGSNRPRK